MDVGERLVRDLAAADGRDYITPEDINDAARANPDKVEAIRVEVLFCLGNVGGVGLEDRGLCAFVAAKLKETPHV